MDSTQSDFGTVGQELPSLFAASLLHKRLWDEFTTEARGWAGKDPRGPAVDKHKHLGLGESSLPCIPGSNSCFALAQLDVSIQIGVLPRVLCMCSDTWHLFPWEGWV